MGKNVTDIALFLSKIFETRTERGPDRQYLVTGGGNQDILETPSQQTQSTGYLTKKIVQSILMLQESFMTE